MGRRAKGKQHGKAEFARPGLRPTPNWPLLALSVLGVALAGYLSWTALTSAAVQGCAEGGGCDAVLSSRWATLLGLPTAVWGLLTYLTLVAIAFIPREEKRWRWAWTVAFFGTLYSVYLTTISLTTFGATCPYCLTSLALMTSILALATIQRPIAMKGFSWQRWLTWRGAISAGLIVFLHLNYIGVVGRQPGVEDPLSRALAIHLTKSGAVMYGAHWCEHCRQQKESLRRSRKTAPLHRVQHRRTGLAANRPNAATGRSRSYPTWFINGQRYEELLTPARLAQMTGFQPPATPPTSGGEP